VNSRAQAKASSTKNASVITAGEAFPDGAMIELVRGLARSTKPNLLLWKGNVATIASQVRYRDCTYEAPELAPSIRGATRLPRRCADYGSVRQLFSRIVKLFSSRLRFSDRESRLLTSFSMSTWLADRLPIAPGLVISGPDQGAGIEVLRLLSCVCRHPILLAEVSPGGFRSLPMYLSLTLLINQQGVRPNMQRLLLASSYRGLHLPGNRGSVVNVYGPKAIFCGTDTFDTSSDGVMQISMTPSQLQWPTLDDNTQDKIANEFQPLLLSYRLKNHAKMRDPKVDVAEFTFVTRQLARSLAACLSEDPGLARETISLLRPQDEEVRQQRSRDVACVVVEVLWALVHKGKLKDIAVEELRKDVNALLRSRGETLTYSAEDIGWKLRELGIPRHTTSAGRKIVFTRDTSRNVHRLAAAYDVPKPSRFERCQDCTVQAYVSKVRM
jgi:hypothetical protein